MKKNCYAKIATLCILLMIFPFSYYVLGQCLERTPKELPDRLAEITTPDIFQQAEKRIQFYTDIFNSETPWEMQFIEINGLFQRIAGKHYIEDVVPDRSIVKDNHGFLHFTGYWYMPNTFQAEKLADPLEDFYLYLNKRNIPLLYVAAPEKNMQGYTKFPALIKNYGNDNVDAFLEQLGQKDIPYLDLRAELAKLKDKDHFFYYTDHHWTTPTAFWGFQQVVNTLNHDFNFRLDPQNKFRNSKNYTIQNNENGFVGTQGRRVGQYFTQTDDFILLLPQFATDYTFEQAWQDNAVRGTYAESLLQSEYIENEDKYTNRYAAFLGGDYPLTTITNHKQNNGIKLLVIKDSFADPLLTFLAACVEEIQIVDLRYYTQSLYTLTQRYRPNAVLFLYSSASLTEDMFSFTAKKAE